MGRKNKLQKENLAHDRLAARIAGFGLKAQGKLAVGLNNRLSKLSAGKIKVCLLVFCLCGAGLSVYYVVEGIFKVSNSSLRVEPIRIPYNAAESLERNTQTGVDEETYKKIQAYRRYMDSTDQPIRAGLLDSMQLLEEIYLSQQKTKNDEK